MLQNLKSLLKISLFFYLVFFLVMYAFTLSIPKPSLYTISYSILAPLNQSFAICLILFVLQAPLIWLKSTYFRFINTVFFGSTLLILLIDHYVYNLYKFHINGFFINMFFTDFASFGFSFTTLLKIFSITLFSLLFCFFIPVKIQKYLTRKIVRLLFAFSIITLLIGQGIHAYSHAHNMSSILRFTPAIPWYYPLIAVDDLKKYGLINEELKQEYLAIKQNNSDSFNYPINELQCQSQLQPNIVLITIESWRFDALSPEITPNIHKIGEEGLIFNEHLSGGNVTTKGLFSLFYGISPIYWNDALAANSEPVMINHLRNLNYDFSILANQDIERNDISGLFFGKIQGVQSHKNSNSLKGDKALVQSFKDSTKGFKKPFFSFLFFNSTHHSYYFPKDEVKPFTPSKEIEMSSLTNNSDPKPYLNQYFNAAFKIDQYIKEIKDYLIEQDQWDNTILIITGDHAEEFNEQKLNYWGHGSNFSKYQLQVPLVMHWGEKHQIVNHRTSHMDVFSTILQDQFNCSNDLKDYSSGNNLFDPSERTIVVSSYINYAIINKDRVDEMIASYVDSYNFNNKNSPAGERSPDLIQKSSSIMSQFK